MLQFDIDMGMRVDVEKRAATGLDDVEPIQVKVQT